MKLGLWLHGDAADHSLAGHLFSRELPFCWVPAISALSAVSGISDISDFLTPKFPPHAYARADGLLERRP